jgi:hypothetical protein
MFKGLIHEAQLKFRMKTGFSGGIIVAAALAAVAAVMTFIFLCVAGYVWLARYFADDVIAALIMAGLFFAMAIIALLSFVLIRRGNIESARSELVLAAAARKQNSLFDPAMLLTGVQVMKAIGFKRLVPIAGAALLAAGIGREIAARTGRQDERKS